MFPRPRIAIALVVILAAISAPILASVYLAWHQSLSSQKAQGLTYSHDVLRRVDETAQQFATAKREMDHAHLAPCSPQDLAMLRQIALGSSYLQAVARASRNSVLCDSQGVTTPASLGPPSLISAHHVAEYFNIKLSPRQWRPLDVFVAGQTAAVVDPSLAIDVATEGPDIELTVFVPSAPDRTRIASLGGNFRANWFQTIPPGSENTVLENGYIVTQARSAKWDLAVVSAIPEHYVYLHVFHFALIFTPIGVLCGILLAWAVNYIAQHRSSFPTTVRRAVRNREFFVEYQPIVELQSRRIVGAEALVRWKTPLATIPPDHFIPLAEERGLMHLITGQVLAMVASDLPRILALDPSFEVAINMSSSDLKSGQTIERLDHLLAATGAQPRNIGIEATERAYLHDRETAQLIGVLRSKGFRVAIDDFGTGYSSLACLQSLSLDTLKIDKAFVDTIDTDGATSQVVHHIIEMARSLQLELVAEGVETEAQAQFLALRGVRYAQGWLFGKPRPIAGLLNEIERRSNIDAPVSVLA
ncbi:MAG TPA: EAL domain-containing protein [Terracidiphilus sp.]|jgi:sensor c-di-GMP phosphodiesterase-like protein